MSKAVANQLVTALKQLEHEEIRIKLMKMLERPVADGKSQGREFRAARYLRTNKSREFKCEVELGVPAGTYSVYSPFHHKEFVVVVKDSRSMWIHRVM
jgi:hypothetical protein